MEYNGITKDKMMITEFEAALTASKVFQVSNFKPQTLIHPALPNKPFSHNIHNKNIIFTKCMRL